MFGKEVTVLIDTGSTDSHISDKLAQKANINYRQNQMEISAFGDHVVRTKGLTKNTKFEKCGRKFAYAFYIIETDLYDVLLGYD